MHPPDASAREIVRRSGSNLAFALAVLPRAVRRDMEVFYGFCRSVDDLADEAGLSLSERRAGLERWRGLVGGAVSDPRPGMEREFDELRRRRELEQGDLLAIIEGMEMDLEPRRFESTSDLRAYCYRAAAAVGLVSVAIFGCRDSGSRAYAEELGYALQWTNILRDVASDSQRGRIYFPAEDLRHFGIAESDLLAGRPAPDAFRRLMRRHAAVARAHYRESLAVFAALPSSDRAALRSAELMRRIYGRILAKMEGDGFRVFATRYRLSRAAMIGEFLRAKFGA